MNLTDQNWYPLCQDIMFLHSRGTRPTPKSIALGMTMRHLTGSKLVSQILSGFGHSISYDAVLRAETAIAQKHAAAVDTVPERFVKHKFTLLVYENIDFAEETISGGGTTHHINGIMVQLKKEDQPDIRLQHISERQGTSSQPRSLARSFQCRSSDIAPFFVTRKEGPQTLSVPSDESIHTKAVELLKECNVLDTRFAILKSQPTDPPLPSWTAFNINQSKPLPESVVHYLPVIDASPTELSTVRHILEDAVKHADILECDQIMVVFDQAI